MFAPGLTLLILTIAVPDAVARSKDSLEAWQRTVWMIAFVPQFMGSVIIVRRWMFSKSGHLSSARSPFLLVPIYWLILSLLGQLSGLSAAWGIDLPAMCFGMGSFTGVIAIVSILQNLHTPEGLADKGQPGLFLFVAPPALSALCVAQFQGKFGVASVSLFGIALCLQFVVLSISYTIAAPPAFMGVYWAYTIAPSVLASAAIAYATAADTIAVRVLAVLKVCSASLFLLVVVGRFLLWETSVLFGTKKFNDPLVAAFQKAQATETAAAVAAAVDAAAPSPTVLTISHTCA